jgi:tellurite resistance protein
MTMMTDDQLLEMYGMARELRTLVKDSLMRRMDAMESSQATLATALTTLAAAHSTLEITFASHVDRTQVGPAGMLRTRRDRVRTAALVVSVGIALVLGVLGFILR